MHMIHIKELFQHAEQYYDQTIQVCGWIRSIRDSKNFGFIVINDGTFFQPLQIVYDNTLDNLEQIRHLNVGASLIISGRFIATPDAKQPFELHAGRITIEGTSSPDYPLQKKRHSLEYAAHDSSSASSHQYISGRIPDPLSAAYAIHKFFQENDFVYVHTPLITANDCEGAGEMFHVTTFDLDHVPENDQGRPDYSQDFFGKETNLTVSGQLNGETYAMAFQNIYTFGPTFRAENSNTARHARRILDDRTGNGICRSEG